MLERIINYASYTITRKMIKFTKLYRLFVDSSIIS